MTRSLGRAAPMRFLIGVTVSWIAIRGMMLADWSPSAASPDSALARSQPSTASIVPPLFRPPRFAAVVPAMLRTSPATTPALRLAVPPLWHAPQDALRSPSQDAFAATQLMMLAAYMSPAGHIYRRASGLAEAATTADNPASSKRLSGSAWMFLRGGGRATTLSPGGQVGGGQAGARVLYRLDHAGRLTASARISTAIGGARQTEAAVGLDWKPVAKIPVHLMAERRIAIDRGGRNAWTLGAAGGVYDVKIATGWRLDGYAEAGVVGARRRDLYADGAARIARAVDLGSGRSLAFGGGVWGAAQPGAARLDVGPSVVLRMPIEHHVVAVALDWRERVLGHAKPGSGLALTVATDF